MTLAGSDGSESDGFSRRKKKKDYRSFLFVRNTAVKSLRTRAQSASASGRFGPRPEARVLHRVSPLAAARALTMDRLLHVEPVLVFSVVSSYDQSPMPS